MSTALNDLSLTRNVAPGSRAATVAAVGAAGFGLAAVVGPLLQPDSYSSVRDTISVLAGQQAVFGELMVAGFLALSVGLAAAAIGSWKLFPMLSGRIAGVLLLIASTATAVAGLARVACNPGLRSCLDALEASPSISTEIHGRAALLVFAPLILAAFVLARAVWRAGDRTMSMSCLGIGVIDVGLIIAVEELGLPIAGLLQRVFAMTSCGLPVLVLWRQRSRRARDARVLSGTLVDEPAPRPEH